MHHSVQTEKDKPEIIQFYNSTKAGVDAMDQKCANYCSSRRTQRWPMAIFHAILGMSSANSYILYNCFTDVQKKSR